MEKIKSIIQKCPTLIIFITCIIFSLIFGNINENIENDYGITIIIVGFFILFSIFIVLDKLKLIKGEHIKYFIFSFIFIIYIGYIINTNCATRQHDTRSLDWENGGHFGYINYILENKKLPDFNPTTKWCFSNPPLFYILSAIFVKIQNLFGRQGYQAIENLQYLTVFFTMSFLAYTYKILELLEIKKMKNFLILFIGLSPAIVYLSGSLNNDVLSIFLLVIAIYYTIKWYKQSKFKDLIVIALSISLAMMTKINSAIIAIPIAIVFLIKLIKEKQCIKKYILYYCVFGLIALPIGLWFPVKNLIKYNVPITYIQTVVEGKENPGYIGQKGLINRIFTADKEHLKTLNLKFEKGKSDYNIFLTTLKSFMVDEQIDYSSSLILKIALYGMFGINIIFLVFFIISIFENKISIESIFLYLILVFEILFYIKFCINYPYAFTMNFRYIVPTIIVLGVGLGQLAEKNNKIKNVVQNLIILYTLFSVILFINI